jgi:short-subunit dehydrogenase
MELDGTRWIVAGATGVLGGELVRGLVDRGARVVPLGRAWTQAARRELRRDGVTVLEARPHHMETGFAEKALTGAPPPVRDALDSREVAAAVLDALAAGRREVAYDIKARELAVR